jgi:eukaryotic-like serine/threonine-protein kinase
LSGRAILYARLGERDQADADAKKALDLAGDDPRVIYQLAGVYAQSSRKNPDDKTEAIRLLASALRKGFGANFIETDRDLDPIRSDKEFLQLVRTIRPSSEVKKESEPRQKSGMTEKR